MAKKTGAGGINKSQAIRDLLKENPNIKGNEAIATLAKKGIEIKYNLFQFVKGSVEGGKKKSPKVRANGVVAVSSEGRTAPASALATIRLVKSLASDVGGLRTLKQIVDALSD